MFLYFVLGVVGLLMTICNRTEPIESMILLCLICIGCELCDLNKYLRRNNETDEKT